MRVVLDLNEEVLGSYGHELWSIAQGDMEFDHPGDVIDSVKEIVSHLEEWLSSARSKAGAWIS